MGAQPTTPDRSLPAFVPNTATSSAPSYNPVPDSDPAHSPPVAAPAVATGAKEKQEGFSQPAPPVTTADHLGIRWDVAVATRSIVTSKAALRDQAVSACTCSSILHIELLVRVRCTGPETCPYRDEKRFRPRSEINPGWRHAAVAEGFYHVIAFYCRETDVVSGISCDVDPIYRATGGWSFLQLTLSLEQRNKLERFCLRQLGQPYSSQLCCFVNAMCCACCLETCDCTPFGVYPPLYQNKGGDAPLRSWFCSEFVTTALLAAGVPLGPDIRPSAMHPGAAYDRIVTTESLKTQPLDVAQVIPFYDRMMIKCQAEAHANAQQPAATATAALSNKPAIRATR